MSLPIFPSLPLSIAYDVFRSPMMSTRVMTARSGKEYRAPNWSFGKYKYSLPYSVLRADLSHAELQTLIGFCNSQFGMFLPFLFDDTSDDTVVNQTLFIGDGVTKTFPLVRTYGGFVEPVLAANVISQIAVAGTPTAAYAASQVGAYGIDTITMTAAPAINAVVTGNFTFYWPCRLLSDTNEFNNFASQLWALKKLEFQTVK